MASSLWTRHQWTAAKALNGFLLAVFFPVPFVLAAQHFARPCAGGLEHPFCGAMPSLLPSVPTSMGPIAAYFVMALALLYVPMYVMSRLPGCNGWLNDLNWTIIPPLALWHYTCVVSVEGLGFTSWKRAGMLWAVVLLWAARLTHNYARREEYTWGAQEDFRFQRMSRQYGAHWWWVSFFAQFISQHVTETLLCVPYLYVLRDVGPTSLVDIVCAQLAVMCILGAAIADNELREYQLLSKDPTKCLTYGMWAYSRHPNYLCESTFHWAIGLWAVRTTGWWIVLCPAFNSLILVISARLKEEHMREGPRAQAFAEYCKRTPMIL